jgi:hypothetical protein
MANQEKEKRSPTIKRRRTALKLLLCETHKKDLFEKTKGAQQEKQIKTQRVAKGKNTSRKRRKGLST